MPKKDRAALLVRAFYRLLMESSESDLLALEEGRASLLILIDAAQARPPKALAKGSNPAPTQAELFRIVERLQAQTSREDGAEVLAEAKLTRRGLEALARTLDVPVLKDDNLARMQGRIIEAAIGGRLNSSAIRGT